MRKVTNTEFQVRQFFVRNAAPAGFRILGRIAGVAETRFRRTLAIERHVRGSGIEVGAAASPAIVPLGCRVTYVDKYGEEALRSDPELAEFHFSPPDVIDSAESLATFATNSQDFVLAFSVFEHLQDPLAALRSFCRVVRDGGTIVVSVPDKRRYRLDTPRPVTTFEHLLRDFEKGPDVSRADHFREVGQHWYSLESEALDQFVRDGLERDSHCHFHVWDSEAFLRFFLDAKAVLNVDYDVLEFASYGVETLAVLGVRRGAGASKPS
jgi:SAM-dependent methyltransferase